MFHNIQSNVVSFQMTGSYAEIDTEKDGCHFLLVTSVNVTKQAIVFNSYESQVSFRLTAFDKVLDLMKLKASIKAQLRKAASTSTASETTIINSDGATVLDIAAAEMLFSGLTNNRIKV